MRANLLSNAGTIRPEDHEGSGVGSTNDAGGFRQPLPVDSEGRSMVGRRTAGERRSRGRDPQSLLPGLYLAGGSVHPGPGAPMAALSGRQAAMRVMAGPCFDQEVAPGGYAWWYVDAISDDRQHGLTVIAFIGSVFSPILCLGWTAGSTRSLRRQCRALRSARLTMGNDGTTAAIGCDSKPRHALTIGRTTAQAGSAARLCSSIRRARCADPPSRSRDGSRFTPRR